MKSRDAAHGSFDSLTIALKPHLPERKRPPPKKRPSSNSFGTGLEAQPGVFVLEFGNASAGVEQAGRTACPCRVRGGVNIKRQLVAFFAFCRDFGIDPTEPKGSYAGAMGWAQFMPSNYRRLAVDFDGDGERDLWQPADAIGSVARYLVDYDPARRWRRGEPLMVPARLTRPLHADVPVNTSRSTHRAADLPALGLESSVELPPETPVGIVRLQLDQGEEYWLGLHNFYSLMSYNPRVYYAMTVSQLAAAMARLDAERQAER